MTKNNAYDQAFRVGATECRNVETTLGTGKQRKKPVIGKLELIMLLAIVALLGSGGYMMMKAHAISVRPCVCEPLPIITAEDILMGSDNYKSIPDDDPAYDAETGVYMTFLAEDE